MSSFPFNQEQDPDQSEIVTLIDEEGRSLECYIENALETDDATYLLLMPVDIPGVIIAWEDGEDGDEDFAEAILLEDTEEIAAIFADAKAVLAEHDLILQNTAFTLTIKGELPPIDEDSILTLELDGDGNGNGESQPIEAEELQFLASFYHEEHKYSIYTPIAPLLFLAKSTPNGDLELVSPEDEDIQPILEDLLFEELD
jgi:hypothetical protein